MSRFIKCVLISVFDKIGIVEFVQVLVVQGVEILFIGGIFKLLWEYNIVVIEVFDYIGFFEMMDGWVKILYLKVYGGILGWRGIDDKVMVEYGIIFIDLVVVNLYLFEKIVVNFDCDLVIVIENIDIGGLMMVCFLVKNYYWVIIVVNVFDYGWVIEEMCNNQGSVSD